jgi:hypothetical protein
MKAVLLAATLLDIFGGPSSPQDNVDSADVVKRLPRSTKTIHARFLPEKDFASITNLPELKHLQFSRGWAAGPAKITDQGVARLASLNLRSLRGVDFGFCQSITDTGLVHIARMDWLHWLSVMACPRITDAGLQTLVNMTNLMGLNLQGCPQITDRSLDILASRTNWETIRLSGCTNVTADAVARLQGKLPNTKVEKNDRTWEQNYLRYRK